jgi:hypothetical protein
MDSIIEDGNERMARRAFRDYLVPEVAYPELIDCGRIGFPPEAISLSAELHFIKHQAAVQLRRSFVETSRPAAAHLPLRHPKVSCHGVCPGVRRKSGFQG